MMHFVCTLLIMSAQAVRLIAIEKVRSYRKFAIEEARRNYRKFYRYRRGSKLQKICIVSIFENGWWEDAYTPHPNPLDPPLAISCRNHHKNLAYFSHLAPLVIDCFFFKRQIQKVGRHGTMAPSTMKGSRLFDHTD